MAPGAHIVSVLAPSSAFHAAVPELRDRRRLLQGRRHVDGRSGRRRRRGPAPAGPPDAHARSGQDDPDADRQADPAARPARARSTSSVRCSRRPVTRTSTAACVPNLLIQALNRAGADLGAVVALLLERGDGRAGRRLGALELVLPRLRRPRRRRSTRPAPPGAAAPGRAPARTPPPRPPPTRPRSTPPRPPRPRTRSARRSRSTRRCRSTRSPRSRRRPRRRSKSPRRRPSRPPRPPTSAEVGRMSPRDRASWGRKQRPVTESDSLRASGASRSP